jgi:hypothetical protein
MSDQKTKVELRFAIHAVGVALCVYQKSPDTGLAGGIVALETFHLGAGTFVDLFGATSTIHFIYSL